jgi:plasmid stability protein
MREVPALHVRNVPPEVYEALRARASREGRSMNAEVIAILRRALASRRDPDDLIADLRRFRERVQLPPDAPTPEDLIREDRDAGHRGL